MQLIVYILYYRTAKQLFIPGLNIRVGNETISFIISQPKRMLWVLKCIKHYIDYQYIKSSRIPLESKHFLFCTIDNFGYPTNNILQLSAKLFV